jgi:hypothetical protein
VTYLTVIALTEQANVCLKKVVSKCAGGMGWNVNDPRKQIELTVRTSSFFVRKERREEETWTQKQGTERVYGK